MRRKFVAGNWKMNGSLATNAALLSQIQSAIHSPIQSKIPAGSVQADCDIAVCVPAPYLAQCQVLLADGPIALGGQDVSAQTAGAFTGDTAASMLFELGCAYVIVGHSERRAGYAETNAQVAQKALQALAAGLTPIICVGETLAQREAGQTNAIVGAQLAALLDVLPADQVGQLVVAYEPVWAIGTGKTATPEMAQEVHAMLRAMLVARHAQQGMTVRILYGGSMKPENAAELMAMADIDGGLIGGAALKAADFLAIIAAASAVTK